MILTVVAVLALAASPVSQTDAQDARPESALERRPAELPRAEPSMNEGWRQEPTPWLYEQALLAYGRDDDIPSAIDWLHTLLLGRPDYPPATLMLGGMYFRLRRYEDAVECFGRFLAAAPGEVGRTRQLGHSLYSLGRFDAAREHYERLLDLAQVSGGLEGEPRAAVLRGLGLSRQRLGDLEAALEALDAAVELDPSSGPTLLARAGARDEAGDPEGALEDALAARALDPFDPRPAFLAATLLADAGRAEEADAQFQAFERLAPVDARVRDLEFRILHRPGDVAAIEELAQLYASIEHWAALDSTLRRLAPRSLPHAKLSATLLAERAPGAAARAAEVLRSQYASEVEAWRALASYFATLGQDDRADAARARAAELGGD